MAAAEVTAATAVVVAAEAAAAAKGVGATEGVHGGNSSGMRSTEIE